MTHPAPPGVAEVLARFARVQPGAITRTTRLHEDLHIDSLAAIDLAVQLEDALGIRVPDEAAEQARTAGDLFDLVAAAKADGPGTAG